MRLEHYPLEKLKKEILMEKFQRMLARLDDALQMAGNGVVRDAAIKRFDIAFMLSLQLIRIWLQERVAACASSLVCLKEAYRRGLISDEAWIRMRKLKSDSMRSYRVEIAERVHGKLPEALVVFRELAQAIEKNS